MKKAREAKRVSEEAVKAKTGKAWAEWFRILDQAGAKEMPHKEIAAYLHEKRGLSAWWCQMVAVAYEHERGLRQKFQNCDGDFSANSSRTFSASTAALFKAWTEEKLRTQWLPRANIEITTATPGRSVRAKWEGETRLSVYFHSGSAGKTRVAVDHMKLPSSQECLRMKSYWSEALGRLERILDGQSKGKAAP